MLQGEKLRGKCYKGKNVTGENVTGENVSGENGVSPLRDFICNFANFSMGHNVQREKKPIQILEEVSNRLTHP